MPGRVRLPTNENRAVEPRGTDIAEAIAWGSTPLRHDRCTDDDATVGGGVAREVDTPLRFLPSLDRFVITRETSAPGLRWAHLDSNQGPTGYEPAALTAELWAQTEDGRLNPSDREVKDSDVAWSTAR